MPPCAFKKALLACDFHCRRARRETAAVAASLVCGDEAAARRCAALLATLRRQARFALGYTDPGARLPHGKLLKLQCGGLSGLARLLGGGRDADALVAAALARYGNLEALLFQALLGEIRAHRPRRRAVHGLRRPER